MTNKYFIISVSTDGVYINTYTEQQMKDKLGNRAFGDHVRILNGLPNESDPHQWPTDGDNTSIVIIRGNVVIPKPKKVVTEYEL